MATSETAAPQSLELRLRLGTHDAHYGGNLVDGAKLLALFGDVATGLLVKHDGDEGLFAGYESVEFLAPAYAGDFVEIRGAIVRVGTTSRTMSFEAWKIIEAQPKICDSAAQWLVEPILLCRAKGTCVVPKTRA